MLLKYKIKGDLKYLFTEHALQTIPVYGDPYKEVAFIISSAVYPLEMQKSAGETYSSHSSGYEIIPLWGVLPCYLV
jgi:hypothetical protein